MGTVRTRILAAASAVAVLAAGATGIALADDSPQRSATPTADPTSTVTPHKGNGKHPAKVRKHRGGRPGLRGGPPGLRPDGPPGLHQRGMRGREPLHGEFVVADPDGGYQTLLVQHGKATQVSATTITVRSADGFTTTYAVPKDTLVNAARDGITTIKAGTEVHVLATKKGTKATALRIGDLSARKKMHEESGLDGPARGA